MVENPSAYCWIHVDSDSELSVRPHSLTKLSRRADPKLTDPDWISPTHLLLSSYIYLPVPFHPVRVHE